MTGVVLFAVGIFWVAPIVVAHALGKPKHRLGWAYGLFLGWLGVVIIAVLPVLPASLDYRYGECPYCRESVRFDASVCPHCRRAMSPA